MHLKCGAPSENEVGIGSVKHRAGVSSVRSLPLQLKVPCLGEILPFSVRCDCRQQHPQHRSRSTECPRKSTPDLPIHVVHVPERRKEEK